MKTHITLAALAFLFVAGTYSTSEASTCNAVTTTSITCDAYNADTMSKVLTAEASIPERILSLWSGALPQLIQAQSEGLFSAYDGQYNEIASWSTSTVSFPSLVDVIGFVSRNYDFTYTFDHGTLVAASAALNQVTATIYDFRVGSDVRNGALAVTGPVVNLPVSLVAVPGPEAGAGLGALAMLGAAYWAKRRRDEHTLAA